MNGPGQYGKRMDLDAFGVGAAAALRLLDDDVARRQHVDRHFGGEGRG